MLGLSVGDVVQWGCFPCACVRGLWLCLQLAVWQLGVHRSVAQQPHRKDAGHPGRYATHCAFGGSRDAPDDWFLPPCTCSGLPRISQGIVESGTSVLAGVAARSLMSELRESFTD